MFKRKDYLQTDKSFENFNYDIILIAGQSNAQGYGKGDEQLKYIPHDPICGYTEGKGFHLACDNRFKRNNIAASFALYFAQEYCRADLLKDNRKLLLLNTAVGGTGFSDKRWGRNNDLSNRMLRLADEILKMNSNNRITAVLWHQGETDVINRMDSTDYFEKLKQLILNTRKTLNIEDVPFISGNMSPIWMLDNPYSYKIADVTEKLMAELPFCGYVDSKGLQGNKTPDIIHFSRKSCEQLGKRYFEKYKEIVKI